MKEKNKLLTIARWLLFLPSAVIGSWLLYLAYNIINYTFDSEWESFINGTEIIAHGILGCAFVWIGTAIAPSHKNTVSVILLVIACILAGLAIYGNYINGFRWWNFFCELSVILGAGIFTYYNSKD